LEDAVTVYQALLAKGYFPRELPPAFFTERFAEYAASRAGASTISKYKPADNYTECVRFQLARPGLDRRELRIPHPASFARLAYLTAKNMKRLLRLAKGPDFSRSRPSYSSGGE